VSERFSAQLDVPGWDDVAQARLTASTVFVIGAGARGGVVAGYLAASGVGHLNLVDGDDLSLSELNRQLLHFTPDVTANKSESVRAKIALLNPEVHVDPFPADLDESNLEMILEAAEFVVDCANDYATSRLINDHCVQKGIRAVLGGTSGWQGSLLTVLPGESGCLRCAEPEGFEAPGDPKPSLGPVSGAIGSLQALEMLKIVSGIGKTSAGAIKLLDARDLTWSDQPVQRMADCICARG
jgi:adenylyltransferase/sulfurtransferase